MNSALMCPEADAKIFSQILANPAPWPPWSKRHVYNLYVLLTTAVHYISFEKELTLKFQDHVKKCVIVNARRRMDTNCNSLPE